ncbi:division plane positioning ATPase MipZ [Vibrio coralliirubri]|uniref:division plane positioning ATPase MipZ n=1 Tax=Vibrio coralliirubri TaxID=1516159 RepID=UPI000A3A6D56|nr:division plane positioning ATPase MipZ [Vibrio coralliirubri]
MPVPPNERDPLPSRLHPEDELTVIDCGGFDSNTTRLVIAMADLVLTPTTDDAVDQFGLNMFADTLASLSAIIGKDVVAHVLPNRI